jgi:hypothetical protein
MTAEAEQEFDLVLVDHLAGAPSIRVRKSLIDGLEPVLPRRRISRHSIGKKSRLSCR